VPLSALSGENCDRLLEVVVRLLPEGDPLYPPDALTDQPERRLVTELIREKILAATRQELPHETAVMIDAWRAREDGLVEIAATIYCERDSQKAIIVGRGGGLLKKVGTGARLEIERVLGARVMLRLWVKVRRGWRENESILRQLGIGGD
jgi:GTP-binding protein Era